MNKESKAIIIVSTLILLLILIIWGLGSALFPLLTSFALAYLAFPLVQKLEKRKIKRVYAVIGFFILYSVISLLIMAFIIPLLFEQTKDLFNDVPRLITTVIDKIEAQSLKLGYEIHINRENFQNYLIEHMSLLSSDLMKSISQGIFSAVGSFTKWLLTLLNFFLIPLFFFHLINDYEALVLNIKSLIPKKIQPKLNHYFELSNQVLNGYIRGQLVVILILSLLYSVGLAIVGVRFGVLIGIMTGLLSLIPYVGFSIGFIIALSMGVIHQMGLGHIVGIVFVYLFVQVLEGTMITPKLVGNKVGLSPLATILALIMGGNLAGMLGMLIAIPTAAILKSIAKELLIEYRNLELI